MGLAEGTTYLEFLTNGKGLLRAYNLKTADATALAHFEWDEVGNRAKVDIQLLADELGELLLCVVDSPTVEVGRLLIVVVEHL